MLVITRGQNIHEYPASVDITHEDKKYPQRWFPMSSHPLFTSIIGDYPLVNLQKLWLMMVNSS